MSVRHSARFCGDARQSRGELLFDSADLIQDIIVLPWVFICAEENATEQEFRQQYLQSFTKFTAAQET
jgi:CRISPR-associated protein Cas1